MSDQNNNWQQQAWQQQNAQQQQGYYQAPQSQPIYYQEPPKQKGKGWIVAIVTIVMIFALLMVGLVSCTQAFTSSIGGSSLFSGTGVYDELDFLSEDAIGIITIDGTIQYDGTTSSPEGLKEQLDRAEENSRVKAVVLRIDSGGGSAAAGEEMTQYVQDFSKPIVVSSASTNASAAYMISSQTDYIYTTRSTSIGSIGTAFQITDLSGLYEMLGIGIENITSSDSKDSSYGTRALTEEEREHYQEMVDQINENFIEVVADGREMTVEDVREVATGMIFTGVDAVEYGLADEIGTYEDALNKAANLAGISDYTTIQLQSYTSNVLSLLDLFGYSTSLSEEELIEALKELEKNGLVSQ